ncbi:MAG TPA: hypothetical protein VMD98_11825 [Bryocella sp.]|nr:hypothetical protein [Bryocella sp.]
MAKRLVVAVGIVLLCATTYLRTQQFPLWEQLLHHYGGENDHTPVPSMKMGNHMQMSLKAAVQPGDEERADQIRAAAREVLKRYADADTALRDGYKPFHPTGRMGEEVHYTNYRVARREQTQVNYGQPGSILYKRTPQGMQAVGVMYTAPQNASPEQLNAIVPLSIATWHRHVDFCGAPQGLPLNEQFGAQARFGPLGSIHTEEACKDAHGLWIPVVFGWMTHVYPDAKNEKDVWGGMDMAMDANSDEDVRSTNQNPPGRGH